LPGASSKKKFDVFLEYMLIRRMNPEQFALSTNCRKEYDSRLGYLKGAESEMSNMCQSRAARAYAGGLKFQLLPAVVGFERTRLSFGRIIVFASLLLITASAQANNWYVDKAATGAANGTSWANAWTSLGSITGISPGDTVYISGGTTSQTYPVPNGWSPAGGTAAARITYQTGQDAGHNGIVILDGQKVNYVIRNCGSNITFSGNVGGSQHMRLLNDNNRCVYINTNNASNMSFNYLDLPQAFGCFYFANNTNITGLEIDHCTIHKLSPPASTRVPDDIFYLGGAAGGAFDTILIHDNYVEIPCNATEPAYGDDGVKWGDGASVYNNHFRIYLDPNYPKPGQHSDVFQVNGNYWKIYNNLFENIGESVCFNNYWGTTNLNFHDFYFYNNVIWQNTSQTISGVARGLDFEPQNNTGSTFTRVIVANNTFANLTTLFCMRFHNAAGWTNCAIVNNLFYNCKSTLATDAPASAISVFYNKAGSVMKSDSIPNTSGPGNNNPVTFVNLPGCDFHLAANDTGAIGAGTNWPSAYLTTDKDGRPRPSGAWSVGAYEYGSVAPLAPTKLHAVP
jgi:hypothetical protein